MTSAGLDVPVLEYRRLVLEHSELPRLWLHPGQFAAAASCSCAGNRRRPCPREDDCFTHALLLDDPTPYRAGVSRWERMELWQDLEDLALRLEPWLADLPSSIQAAHGAAGHRLRVV